MRRHFPRVTLMCQNQYTRWWSDSEPCRDIPDLEPSPPTLCFAHSGWPLLFFKPANLLPACRSLHSWCPPPGILPLELYPWLTPSHPSKFSANVASSDKSPLPRGWSLSWSCLITSSCCFFLRKRIKLSLFLFVFSLIIDCKPIAAGITPTLVTCVSPFLSWCPACGGTLWRCAALVDQLLWGGVLHEEASAASSGNPN